jgi:hypothetical protein
LTAKSMTVMMRRVDLGAVDLTDLKEVLLRIPHTIILDPPVAGAVLNVLNARIRHLVTRGLRPALVRNLESNLRRRRGVRLQPIDRGCDVLVDVAANCRWPFACCSESPRPDRRAPPIAPRRLARPWSTPNSSTTILPG